MQGAVPGTGGRFIRDYLYVDLGRTRSLLAQLYEGVPERWDTAEQKQRGWTAGVSKIFSLGVGGQRVSTEQEQRVLGDLHFAMLEDMAEAAGYLIDVTELAQDDSAWTSGELHSKLSDGRIIRVAGPTQVIDANRFASVVEEMEKLGGTGSPDQSPEALLSALFSNQNEQQSEFQQFAKLIQEVMYGPGVFVRTMPSGEDKPDLAFTGILPTPSEYLSDAERDAILPRFGTRARDWIMVGQVARIGTKERESNPLENLEQLGEQIVDAENDRLDRNLLEKLMADALEYMEGMGVTEAPKWPAVTLVPLAVYRIVEPIYQE